MSQSAGIFRKLYSNFLLLAGFLCTGLLLQGQVLTENFVYTSGTLLTANGYTASSGTGTNNLTVNATGLTYPGSPSNGQGFGVNVANNGQDVNRTFAGISTGSVYFSAFVNLSAASATGDYFTGLMTGTGGSPAFAVRIYARSSGAGFNFGVSKSTGTTAWDANVSSFNTTYLIVAKYTYNGGASDDVINVWVNPALGGTEGAALLTTGAGITDAAAITGIYIRQGTAANAPTLQIDGIRAGTTWAQVTPSGASSSSDIIANTGFLYPTNIDYSLYQGTSLTTANSVEVGQFDIRDGGGAADGDALSTTLTALTLNVANPGSLRRIALFDGSTNIAEVDAGATASFSSLSLAAADDASKTFSVRVSFLSTVTDNQQFSFTVSSATALGSGSSFAAGNAGGAATSTSGDNNKIEVTATDLLFDVDPSNVSINTVMSPAPTVVAWDANLNLDLDFSATVSLSTTGTFAGGATTSVSAVNGTATFSNLLFSATGTGVTINASASGVNPTGNSVAFDVTNPQPEINVKEGANTILSGGSFGFGNQVSGTSSSATTFTIENLGSVTLNLSGSPIVNIDDATSFTVDLTGTSSSVGAASSTTFTVTFNPASTGLKTATLTIVSNDSDEGSYTINLSGTGTSSAASDIISTTGYVYPANVDYAASQSASGLTTGNSVAVQGITLRDGGAGADADNLATTLTDISFNTGGSTVVRTAALFDGATNLAEVAVNGGTTISFSGLSVNAADGGTKDLELRITYQSTVADNTQPVFTVAAATAAAAGSQFAAGDAGGAASSSAGDDNRLEVTASALAFVQQPSNVAAFTAITPAITVSANDANGNRDLDFAGDITISSTGTLSGSSTNTVTAVNGLATFSNIVHSLGQTGRTLNAERATPDLDWDVTSGSFDISTATINYATLGSSFTENFNSLSATGNNSWSNGTSPLLGWFAQAPLSPFNPPTTLTGLQTGGGTSAAFANFGPANSSNRSIGWVYANGVGAAGTNASIGMGISNTTGGAITEFSLSYLGRQWRTNTTTPGSLTVEYKIGGSFNNDNTGWTAAPGSLTFTGPNLTGAAAIDGYAVSNTAFLSGTVSSISWPSNEVLWIRWRDFNDAGTDAQLAIDSVIFSTPMIPNTNMTAYAPQLSSNVVKGNVNVPLAGFTLTADAALNFTGVTVGGVINNTADVTNVRIFNDDNGNGIIDGGDASVSGTGIAFAATMNFTVSDALTANVASNYLIVADLDFNGTSPDVTVGIGGGNFTTSTGTVSGGMTDALRVIDAPVGSSTITAGAGTEPATISSLVNTSGAASLNFDFTITDDGATPATDAEPMEMYSMTITQGSGNDVADWTQLIDGAELSDGTDVATATVNAGNLFFDLSGWTNGASLIDDDASQTYTLKVWLKNNLGALKATIDGSNLVFKIDPTGIDLAGSGFGPGQEQNSGAANNAVDVAASALAYLQQPSNAGTNVPMAPAVTVEAVDANGNRDLGFTDQVRITSTGTLSGSPVDVTAVSGVATFGSLTHTAGGTGLTLNAERTATLDWDVTSATFNITAVTSATDHFRSNVTLAGNWNVAGNWESSSDSSSWITSTLVPNSSAASISIQSGDTISITAAVTVDQVYVRNGGTLRMNAAFTVNNGAGDDILVENGGVMIYNIASTIPTFGTATMRINNGGKLRVQVSGITGATGNTVNASSHIYDNGSILEYGITSTPSSSNVTFFPNADANTVPVLRFTAVVTNWGSTNPTTVNGRLDIASGASLGIASAGIKTFRNGITGAGNLTQGTAGQIVINGATAELGGAGTITLGANGLTIGVATPVTLSSSKNIAGTGAVTNAGVISLNGFTLTAPSLTGTGTVTGSAASSLVLNGASTLRFTTGAQTLRNLTLNAGSSSLATPLYISGGTAPSTAGVITVGSGATFVTNDNLTIGSNIFGTASVAAGNTAGGYITGDVTVERYIPNNNLRAWRLLSVPTLGSQTIRQSWQENNIPMANTTAPGYGTLITGGGNNTGVSQANGFDFSGPNTSMQFWNGTGWSNITGTLGALSAKQAYFLFVRGDRSKGITGLNSDAGATTLRTRGTLYTGDQAPLTVPAGQFQVVPNLYPSAIDFTLLTRTGLSNSFTVWDSKTQVGSSLGRYVTFSGTNSWEPNVSSLSYPLGVPNTTIESGQAFFVQDNTGIAGDGSITLVESAKISGTSGTLGLRPTGRREKLQVNLLSGNEVEDGSTIVFGAAYSNEVNADDARKMGNPGANFAVETDSKILAVEARRTAEAADVIAFRMWNLQQRSYSLEFNMGNIANGLTPLLEDSYTKQVTPLTVNGSIKVDFMVDANQASGAANRFRIVFSKQAAITAQPAFTVSPNPVEGKRLNLLISNQPAGRYTLRLISLHGQVLMNRTINHAGNSASQLISLPARVSAGNYQLEITGPDNQRSIRQVMIQ